MKSFIVFFPLVVFTYGSLFAQILGGMALVLDGDEDYIEILDLKNLEFGDSISYTIELWLNADISQPANLITKMNKPSSESGIRGWKLVSCHSCNVV